MFCIYNAIKNIKDTFFNTPARILAYKIPETLLPHTDLSFLPDNHIPHDPVFLPAPAFSDTVPEADSHASYSDRTIVTAILSLSSPRLLHGDLYTHDGT